MTEKFKNHSLKTIFLEAPEDEEDIFADEEEETEAEPEAEEETDEETDEEADEEAEPEAEEEPEPVDSGESLDAELKAVFIDFETQARKASVDEVVSRRSISLLYENENLDEIDIDIFTSEIARLVKNYENLIDMESIIVTRAKDFIEERYGEELSDSFVDNLESKHDIEIDKPKTLSSELEVPLSLGARSSEG